MFESIRAAIDVLERDVATLDAHGLSGADAARYVALFARGERICAAGKTLTAARVSVTNAWQQR
jgi:hypothetical protein